MIRKLIIAGGLAALLVGVIATATPAVATGTPATKTNCGTFYGHQGTPPCNPFYNGHILDSGGAVKMTNITATWAVPAIRCTFQQALLGASDSIWVGLFELDGTLVQTGVNNECDLRHYHTLGIEPYQRNTAWWKVANALPRQTLSLSLSLPVNTGDVITADVSAKGNGRYVLSLTDTRTGTEIWDFGKAFRIPGDSGYPDAAGVVIEPNVGIRLVPCFNAPICQEPLQKGPLADFGTVTFSNVRYNEVGVGAYRQYIMDYEAQTPPETSVVRPLLKWTVTWKAPGHYFLTLNP